MNCDRIDRDGITIELLDPDIDSVHLHSHSLVSVSPSTVSIWRQEVPWLERERERVSPSPHQELRSVYHDRPPRSSSSSCRGDYPGVGLAGWWSSGPWCWLLVLVGSLRALRDSHQFTLLVTRLLCGGELFARCHPPSTTLDIFFFFCLPCAQPSPELQQIVRLGGE